eukprot:scaffold143_cov260-Pinguiococcus_pyrenoidosus.AAC.49
MPEPFDTPHLPGRPPKRSSLCVGQDDPLERVLRCLQGARVRRRGAQLQDLDVGHEARLLLRQREVVEHDGLLGILGVVLGVDRRGRERAVNGVCDIRVPVVIRLLRLGILGRLEAHEDVRLPDHNALPIPDVCGSATAAWRLSFRLRPNSFHCTRPRGSGTHSTALTVQNAQRRKLEQQIAFKQHVEAILILWKGSRSSTQGDQSYTSCSSPSSAEVCLKLRATGTQASLQTADETHLEVQQVAGLFSRAEQSRHDAQLSKSEGERENT